MSNGANSELPQALRGLSRLVLRLALQSDRVQADRLLKAGRKRDRFRELQAASARRAFIRAAVTYIEGDTNVRIDVLLDLSKHGGLSAEMVGVLRGGAYVVGSDGTPRARDAYQKLIDKVRASFRAYMQLHPESPNFFDTEWELRWKQLAELIEVRNRITHPKTERSLSISDDELQLARDVETWYDHATEGLFGEEWGAG